MVIWPGLSSDRSNRPDLLKCGRPKKSRKSKFGPMMRITHVSHFFVSSLLPLFGVAALLASSTACAASNSWTLDSPSSRLHVKVEQNEGMRYSVLLRGQEVIAPSKIDLKVSDAGWLERQSGTPTAATESNSETLDFVVPRKLGAMTDWDKRELTVPLNFLPSGNYQLDSWADGVNADRDGTDFRYSTSRVFSSDTLTLKLAPGGGWAGRQRPAVGIAR
jgi:hypothetical protein